MRAGVFDPSKIRIFPFLRAINQQSVTVGNESVGKTQPVSTRSLNKRSEVYVKDPKASGKALNEGDRRTTESTLGHLRSSQSKRQRTATLDNLRKSPRPEESQ